MNELHFFYFLYWYYCCDRKSRAAYAQSFALSQQATIEFTCHDHSVIACSRHIHVRCCSSRTSRSWWITQSTQHHRRGCNTAMSNYWFFDNIQSATCERHGRIPVSAWCYMWVKTTCLRTSRASHQSSLDSTTSLQRMHLAKHLHDYSLPCTSFFL